MNRNIIKQVLLEQKKEIKAMMAGAIIVRGQEDALRKAAANSLVKVIIRRPPFRKIIIGASGAFWQKIRLY